MTKKKSTSKEKKVVMEAVVMEGRNEVRRYSKAIHGKNFEKLAEEFVEKHSTESVPLRIELQEAEEGIKCPACGHIFTL